MNAFLIVAFVATALIAVAGVRWWMWRPLIKQRAFIQLGSDESIVGVITSRRGQLLIVEDAVHVAGGQQHPIDGRAVVERARVRWMQVTT